VESAFSRGDYAAALAEAEAWKTASPDSPWARLAVADIQFMTGKRAEASATWQQMGSTASGPARGWAAFRTALLAQNWKAAEEALETLTDSADRSSLAVLKGQMQLSGGDINQARVFFDEAVREGPQNASAHAWLGLLNAVQRQLTTALDQFNKGLSLNPSDPVALWGQGFIAFLDKAYPEAADYFEKSVRAAPGFDLPRFFLAETRMAQGRPGDAVSQIDQLSSSMQETAPVLDLRGRALILEGRWNDALTNWKTFQKKYPKSAVSYFYIAQIHFIQGGKDAARESVEAGLKVAPDDLRLRIARADLLWQSGKRDEALLLATQTAKDRKNLDASIAQAAMHLGQAHFSKASSVLKELLAANPDDPRLYALLHEAQMGLAKEEEAILTLRTGWLRAPKALGLGFRLAAIQEKKNNQAEAISTYREILKTEPGHRRALNQLAWLLAQQQTNLDEALQLADEVCKKDLGNIAALDTRAWILYSQQKFPEARKELEQLIRAAPDQPYVQYHWGLALWKTGDAPGAKAVLTKLLKEQPKFAEIDKVREALKQL
jgi:tetratricopeptide (TPR) repeat protein